MHDLKPYIKRYRREVILAPLFKMLEACFDLLVPLVVAHMVNSSIPAHSTSALVTDVSRLAVMAVLGMLCSFTAQYFAARAAIGTGTGLRRQLMAHVESLSLQQLERLGNSTLITRLTGDVNSVQNGCNMFLRLFLRSPFIVLGALLLSFWIDWQAGLVFLGLIAVLSCIVFAVMKGTGPLYKIQQGWLDRVTGATRETLSGVRVIRAFGREESQQAEFSSQSRGLLRAQKRAGFVGGLLNPLTFLTVNGTVCILLFLGVRWVRDGRLQAGDLIALTGYVTQILVELVKLANLLVLLSKAGASMGRIGEILAIEQDSPRGTWKTSGPLGVSMENVSFTYPGAAQPSLRNITFQAEPGKTLGIIGSTGSGKTTLVRLLTGLYEVREGTVRLGEKPIEAWDPQALPGAVTLVQQKPALFSGTVRSNLLWGDPRADDRQLYQALAMAQGAEFVEKRGGLDSPVEQSGRNLSGGQKQRLAIARGLLTRSAVLILDDSTSALDYGTEAALRKNLAGLSCTRILVSQRISAVKNADRILVLEDGALADQGTHGELLDRCAVYREIWQSQENREDMP